MTDLTPREISQSHLIDDLEREVTAMRRALTDVAAEVNTALDAHNAGDAPNVVAEYLDRSLLRIGKFFPRPEFGTPTERSHTNG